MIAFWDRMLVSSATAVPVVSVVMLLAWLQLRRTKALTAHVAALQISTNEVHTMVNSRLSEALTEIDRLRALIEGMQRPGPPNIGDSGMGKR